jgi:hypothetical protein
MTSASERIVDLDALAACLDSRAEEGVVFDRERGVPRRADSLASHERTHVGEDLVPDPARFEALQPIDYERGLALMQGFVATREETHLRAALTTLLQSAAPFVEFDRRLAREPALRDAWHAYRDRALRALARDWLRANAPEWHVAAAGDDADAGPALPLGVAFDPGRIERARRIRWRAALWTQGIACGGALLSQVPAARWVWLSGVAVALSAWLVPLREALQCSAGPRRGMAWTNAIAQIVVGVGGMTALMLLLAGIFADERALSQVFDSATLHRFLWSDPLVLPATLAVIGAQLHAAWVLRPLLRRDLAHYRWGSGGEPLWRIVAFLLGLCLGAFLGVSFDSAWPVVLAMGGLMLATEHQMLRHLPAPILRPMPPA